MKTLFFSMLSALILMAGTPSAMAAAEVGQPAPDFTGTDTNGNEHSLSDFTGKTVVLEWFNHKCPYVEKHYGSGNMQALQEAATADGVVWLTIVSSAEGKQGYTTPDEANKLIEEAGAKATARILDTEGNIGQMYGAKTTPHMFVIDEEGTLVYAGAIDDNDSYKQETIEDATNYVQAALSSLAAHEPVEVSSTKPYGCGVKY